MRLFPFGRGRQKKKNNNKQNKGPKDALEAQFEPNRFQASREAQTTYHQNYEDDADSMIADRSNQLPRFDLRELSLGAVLGKGRFGTVYEIRNFDLTATTKRSDVYDELEEQRHGGGGFGENPQGGGSSYHFAAAGHHHNGFEEHRKFIANNCLRDDGSKDARYAVKFLSFEVANGDDSKMLACALYDMALETRFLSVILHPNIVKLRAIARTSPFDGGRYFFIMDRLYDTLETRMAAWKKQRQEEEEKRRKATTSTNSLNRSWRGRIVLKTGNGGTRQTATKKKHTDTHHQAMNEDFFGTRVRYCYDLSAAIHYLHGMDIVYRDLKPVNIGFDIRGDIKLFDFGLASELKKAQRDENGLYNMTAMTGSPRYMAPEVALGKPYNENCDVYSLALLIWEMLVLDISYRQHTSLESLRDCVWQGDEERPQIPKEWETNNNNSGGDLKSLLENSWTSNLEDRYTMEDLKRGLRKECVKSRGGDTTGLGHNSRRSTYVFDSSKPVVVRPSNNINNNSSSNTTTSSASPQRKSRPSLGAPTMEKIDDCLEESCRHIKNSDDGDDDNNDPKLLDASTSSGWSFASLTEVAARTRASSNDLLLTASASELDVSLPKHW